MSEFAVFKFIDKLISSYLWVRRFFIHCLQRSDYQVNIIETQRLIINEYSYNDVTELNKILSNPKTMSFWPAPFTEQQTENWIHNNIKRYKELN
jgi:RimJ/RimL family protein N-acetyltransferase